MADVLTCVKYIFDHIVPTKWGILLLSSQIFSSLGEFHNQEIYQHTLSETGHVILLVESPP